MYTPFRQTTASLTALKDLKLVDWLPLLFAVWLMLSVTMPDTVYRAFFHILIYPLTIYLIVDKDNKIIWKDNFVRLFTIFCAYMAITTWLAGNNNLLGNIQASRWGLEAFLGMLAFWLWLQNIISHPRLWGKLFLLITLIGTVSALLSSKTEILANTRIGGIGIMEYPIQGASISITLLAIGIFLTFANGKPTKKTDKSMAFFSILSVCTFVALSQSRAPQITLLFYLVFLGLYTSYNNRNILTIYFIGSLFISLIVSIHWFVGFDLFFEQFKERGMSYRLDIWMSILEHPPESILLGHGAGLDFSHTNAAKNGLSHLEFEVKHAHNIWLGAFTEMGIIGVTTQFFLVAMPIFAVQRSKLQFTMKVHLMAILGIFLLLTMSDEYTLLISIHPIWLIGWLPLVFVWSWCRCEQLHNIG